MAGSLGLRLNPGGRELRHSYFQERDLRIEHGHVHTLPGTGFVTPVEGRDHP